MSRLRLDTAAATVLQGERLVASLAVFLAFRLRIGIPAYGVYSAMLGLVLVIVLITLSWVGPLILQMHFRDGHDRVQILTHVATLALGLGLAGLVATAGLGKLVLPKESLELIVLLFVIEATTHLYFESIAAMTQIREGFQWATAVRSVPVVTRIAAGAMLLTMKAATLQTFVVLLAAMSLGAALLVLGVLLRQHRTVWAVGRPARADVTSGLAYAGTSALYAIQDDADKVMMGSFRPAVEAGQYAAGYRLYQMLMYPVSGLAAATHTTLLQARHDPAVLRKAQRFAGFAALYAIVAGALGFGFAQPLANVLGTRPNMVRLLALIALGKSTVDFWLNCLIGLGANNRRMYLVGATAAVNFFGNLWLIPRFGWVAAAMATLVADLLMSVAGFLLVRVRARRVYGPSPSELGAVSAAPVGASDSDGR